jgi:hypothetical protein
MRLAVFRHHTGHEGTPRIANTLMTAEPLDSTAEIDAPLSHELHTPPLYPGLSVNLPGSRLINTDSFGNR